MTDLVFSPLTDVRFLKSLERDGPVYRATGWHNGHKAFCCLEILQDEGMTDGEIFEMCYDAIVDYVLENP